jgi:hypothetical protein
VTLHQQSVQIHRVVSMMIIAWIETRARVKYNGKPPSRSGAGGISYARFRGGIAMTYAMSRLLPAGGATLYLVLGAFLAAPAYAQSGCQGAWTPKAALEIGRNEVVAAAVNGKVYVLGGNYSRDSYDLAVNEEYDPATGKWRARAPMPSGGNHLGATVLNGKIYTVGGFTKSGHKGAARSRPPHSAAKFMRSAAATTTK